MNGITERVKRGAALLDEQIPGWWQDTDLARLEMSSSCQCVLGQIGSYSEIVEDLGLYEGDDEADCGFETTGTIAGEFAYLTAAWRDLIERRRDAVSVTA